MKKVWKVFCFLSLVLVCLFTSCKSTKTVEIEVPVPVKIDLTDVIDPVLLLRPDNSQIKVNPGPALTIFEVLENQASCLQAWELWENYANALEQTIFTIKERMDNV